MSSLVGGPSMVGGLGPWPPWPPPKSGPDYSQTGSCMCSISLTPQTTHISTFCIAFHSKSQPMDDKLSRKGRGHVT